MGKLRDILLVALFPLFTPPVVEAQSITFKFSGTILSVSDFSGTLNGLVSAGSTFSGSYTFASNTADTNLDPSVGIYQSTAPTGMSLRVGSLPDIARFDGLRIRVRNDIGGVEDDYEVILQPPPAGVQEVRLLFRTRNLARFESDALPLVPLNVADFSDVHEPVLELSLGSGTYITGAVRALSVSAPFTDPTLSASVTEIRLVHVAELRTRIDALRTRYGLGVYAWTDATLVTGQTAVRVVHIAELRETLQAVYVAAGRTAPTYTDAALLAGQTVVKAAHIMELRAAVVAVE